MGTDGFEGDERDVMQRTITEKGRDEGEKDAQKETGSGGWWRHRTPTERILTCRRERTRGRPGAVSR